MSLKSLGRNLIKNVTGVAKIGAGFMAGGPLGGIASAAAQMQRSPVVGGPNPMGASISFNNPFTNPSGLIGGAMGMLGLTGKGHGRVASVNGQCPRGYHLNKHKLADGTPARAVCVRNRSMNALNGRAAMRAVRRVKRAEKLTRKLHIFRPIHRLASGKGRK